jgi:hypothetical protein
MLQAAAAEAGIHRLNGHYQLTQHEMQHAAHGTRMPECRCRSPVTASYLSSGVDSSATTCFSALLSLMGPRRWRACRKGGATHVRTQQGPQKQLAEPV